ncbi:ABC transporter transmembrane domain-containing protein [Martelella mediterranea]|uniref:ATP-binding cassette subfamily B protein n=1 Tax=Martelella mediterranea TaxID=293089 RepID=A0A4R3P134_9HYPH|nr:ABC transporter transmembrane domain-containing protein [Martelella mediterranea]TCT42841.1 ATP-binding cassette subfamily B protein [Martelella mediterranea]
MSRNAKSSNGRAKQLQPLSRLLPYLKTYRGLVSGALFFLLMASLVTLALPVAVRRVIDHGFSADNAALVNNYFMMLGLMALALGVASAMRYYFVMVLGERLVADLRRDVFSHIVRLSPAFFDVNQSGEIVSRLTADTVQIKSAFGASASIALRNLIMGLGALIMMIYTAPWLSVMVIFAIPVIVLPLIAFGRKVRGRSRIAQDSLADASAFASEAIGATRALQAFNGEAMASRQYTNSIDDAFAASRSATRARATLTAIAITLVFCSVTAILWVGAQSVLAGTMTGGTLGQFLLYSVLAAGALGQLSEVWGELSLAAGAAERLSELLSEPEIITAPATPKALPQPAAGRIDIDRLAFCYPTSGAKAGALNGISLSVKSGETVAIVGPSGAGKSTLFALLLRFYDPVEGGIRLDGIDLREADPQAVRQRFAIVPQDVAIFAASIHDNIAIGRPGASREDVRAAAIAAQADGFIEKLEHGYDTLAGERGITLSGGQRQRIAIARAILRDAPILLLDEATSALDAESETLVQQALGQLMQGRTTLVIAHRLATVLSADRLIVMDEGVIVEEGTHDSLVAHNGLYARLARLQFNTETTPEELSG